jgi:hypothetical protein
MSTMKSPPVLESRLNFPSAPRPTVNELGRIMPGTKLRLDARGRLEPEGHTVANPGGAPMLLSTVAFPTNASALAGTVTPSIVNRPGRATGWFGLSGAPGATNAGRPGRESNKRTGLDNGKNWSAGLTPTSCVSVATPGAKLVSPS